MLKSHLSHCCPLVEVLGGVRELYILHDEVRFPLVPLKVVYNLGECVAYLPETPHI